MTLDEGGASGRLTDAERKLVADNLNLVHWFLQRYDIRDDEYDDLFQTCCIGLMNAAQAYRPEKGRFSTLAVASIKNTFLDARRSTRAKHIVPEWSTVSLQSPIRGRNGQVMEHNGVTVMLQDVLADGQPTLDEQLEYKQQLATALDALAEDKLLRECLEDGANQTTVAKRYGVTRQAISRRFRRSVTSARRKIISEAGGIIQ